MSFNRVAVVMAGGSGERFWPVSTASRPKQFLRLASPSKTLLEQSVDRLEPVVGVGNVFVATGRNLVDLTLMSCASLNEQNVLAEPFKRNTAGCLVWVAANLMARNPEDWQRITMAVATADHRIGPDEAFHHTVEVCLTTAERTGGLVTIGIRPDRPETGFGYIEIGQPAGAANKVMRFREKPDLATAKAFLAAGRFLWNSGMFFWTLGSFVSQLDVVAPDLSEAICTIAGALSAGKADEAEAIFEGLRNVSIDVALMERAENVFVVEAEFDWDDLGSWDAMSRSYEPDADGNVFLGESELLYTRDSVIYNETTDQEVCILGMEDVVVVVTDGKVLVCPKSRAQEVRRFSQKG